MESLVRSLLPAAGILVAGYVAICLLVFARQRQMLYYPAQADLDAMGAIASAAGLERWVGSDGTIHGWFAPGDESLPPLVIFHGNAGHALDRVGMIRRLRAAGISPAIYVLDYPGYGSREGTPTETSLVGAAVSAVSSLPSPAVLLGESLGSGVATLTAARIPERVRGLILLTPFDSIVSAAAHHYPWIPVKWLVLDRFDSIAALEGFRSPVAVILAANDTTTPPEGARRLYDSLTGPKSLTSVANAGHNDPLDRLSNAEWLGIWNFASGAVDAPPQHN